LSAPSTSCTTSTTAGRCLVNDSFSGPSLTEWVLGGSEMRSINLTITLTFTLTLCLAPIANAQYAAVDLGRLDGGYDTSALAVNNAGHVVGAAMDTSGHYVAFLYVTSLQGLGSLGGNSKANAINSADQIVGNSITASGDTHAFLYNA